MGKILYDKVNRITSFAKAYFEKDLKVGFVSKTDGSLVELPNIKFELEDMQQCVGGYIQVVPYIKDENFDVIVNEEGVIKELPFNPSALIITENVFYGNVLFLKKGILQ